VVKLENEKETQKKNPDTGNGTKNSDEGYSKKGKKILITSALPYVNNVPHLGNIIGCVLSADVFARFCRKRGYETIYICGTDEYGTATETKALEEGVTPQELCDKYYKIHKDIYEWFGISTDIFGRTTTQLHTEITHEIFNELHKNGFVAQEEIEQAYDEKAQMFLADRFIEGTCPHCKYEAARADQCDKCGHLLNFAELINPISKISKTVPTTRKSMHLFIDLPVIQNEIEGWIEKTAKNGRWSDNSYNIAKAWIAEGLRRRCITRDLKWGVTVPLAGWEKKVFYVWFDAPIGYISITANMPGLEKNWRNWWQNPDNVLLYQFMGKDNVPFHTVIFPSTLIGTRKNWTLLHHISTTEFLNFEGGKFSKSKGVGVFGSDAVDSGIPADVWRYYLLTNRPEKMDTDFTWKDFAEKLNNELLANIGNLVNRTMVFAHREFEGKVPDFKDGELGQADRDFLDAQNSKFEKITQLLEEVQIKDGLHTALEIGKGANAYFQQSAPWKAVKEGEAGKARARVAIYLLLHQVKDLAIALEPYLPFTSAAIFRQLSMSPESWDGIGKLSLAPGHSLGKPEILFKKLEEKEIEALKKKYSGKQQTQETENPKKEIVPGKIGEDCLDLEVGRIVEIERHPTAQKLYVEKIEMGDGQVRQVVSGLVPYFKEEQLLGKLVVVVRNLKPALLRGIESQGMLLAAEGNGLLEVVCPQNAKPGDKVSIGQGKEGKERQEPAGQVTIEEFFTVDLAVKNGFVLANGKRVEVGGRPLTTKIVLDGKVR